MTETRYKRAQSNQFNLFSQPQRIEGVATNENCPFFATSFVVRSAEPHPSSLPASDDSQLPNRKRIPMNQIQLFMMY